MKDIILSAVGDTAIKAQNADVPVRELEYWPVEDQWKATTTYWSVVQQSGGTYTPGTSWLSQFDPDKNAADRMEYRLVTAGGELLSPQTEGSNSVAPRRHTITLYAGQPQTIKCFLSLVGTSSRVQLFINGAFTEYTGASSQYLTLALASGYNTVQMTSNTSTDSIFFGGLLFDGLNVQWVDPQGARNPARSGFTSSGGSSGVGTPTFAIDLPTGGIA